MKEPNQICAIVFLLSLGLFARFTPPTLGLAQTISFGPAVIFTTGSGPASMALGYLNGDGKLDLAVANRNDGSISILLGNPNGAFGPATHVPMANQPLAVALADLNGDGKLDLAVAVAGPGVSRELSPCF